MRYLVLSLFVVSTLLSCKQDPVSGESVDSAKVADLENEIAQLRLDQQLKDSVINESLAFFNEIQSNLEAIALKKDEIRLKSDNPEASNNDKEWILEEIRHINFLREENAKKVAQLNSQIQKSGLKIKELEAMIERLVNDIHARDEQIASLQNELESMDVEYSKLFDAYQEMNLRVDNLTDELHRAYYTYGTTSELVKNGVIEQKNGFIGIGKKVSLLDDFNEKYFAAVDFTQDKELFIEGNNLRMITDHPSSSYQLIPNGANTKLKINNPHDFWKISKYLVIVVD